MVGGLPSKLLPPGPPWTPVAPAHPGHTLALTTPCTLSPSVCAFSPVEPYGCWGWGLLPQSAGLGSPCHPSHPVALTVTNSPDCAPPINVMAQGPVSTLQAPSLPSHCLQALLGKKGLVKPFHLAQDLDTPKRATVSGCGRDEQGGCHHVCNCAKRPRDTRTPTGHDPHSPHSRVVQCWLGPHGFRPWKHQRGAHAPSGQGPGGQWAQVWPDFCGSPETPCCPRSLPPLGGHQPWTCWTAWGQGCSRD